MKENEGDIVLPFRVRTSIREAEKQSLEVAVIVLPFAKNLSTVTVDGQYASGYSRSKLSLFFS
jgi:hypothetical protein